MSQRKFARVPSPLTPLAAATHGHFIRAPGDDLHHFQRRQGRKFSDQLEQSQSTPNLFVEVLRRDFGKIDCGYVPFRDRVSCTVEEACVVTGLGRTTIYELMKKKKIAVIKVGRRTLILIPSLLSVFEG